MGIRFFCPNGHKLNVKSQLAGLRGYCPDCGAELTIPMASTRKSSKEGGGLIDNTETQNQNQQNQQNQILDIIATFNDFTVLQNPILKDESIEWHIHNPDDKSQQGPLTNQTIKKLLQQDKIKPYFYIWYEGLPDWLPASSIFPELG
ncbi:MAG: DUF4339 domain-containing protein [Planctomycetaceae bacterium]|jgi:hypothetical protein|nr:DUF4339 domain-containing protein [Planctomycetaceae bacterium]